MEAKDIEYFKLFRDVCKSINSSLNLKEVFVLITENVIKVLNVKACTIFLLDRASKRLEVSTFSGLSDAYIKKGPVDADKSIAESLEGKAVLVYDAPSDSRTQYPKEAKREGIASILSVPITVKGTIIGVLRIYTSQPRNFSDDEIEFVSGLADMGGIAIDNARMHDYLKKDHENLINEVHRWFEYGQTP